MAIPARVTFLSREATGEQPLDSDKRLRKGSRLDFEITQLRFLTPDAARVQAKGAVVKPRAQRSRRTTRVNTTIAVRTDGQWLLASSQNTTNRRLAEKLLNTFASRTVPQSGTAQ
jgi:hypothetical protein